LAKVQRKSEFLYTRSPINASRTQKSVAEIQSPTQWKVIDLSMATPHCPFCCPAVFFCLLIFTTLSFTSRKSRSSL